MFLALKMCPSSLCLRHHAVSAPGLCASSPLLRRTLCAVLSHSERESHVRLSATAWSVACQVPLSTGILQARILE